MSRHAVEWIAGKIVLDASFRDALIADPDQTLSGFDLSEREKDWLKRIDLETMEALAQTLDLRMGQIRPASKSPFSKSDGKQFEGKQVNDDQGHAPAREGHGFQIKGECDGQA